MPAPTSPTQTTTPVTTTPAVTVTAVRVGTAGNAATAVAPGEKLQLFAQADSSDGTTVDVTNLAVWQSSNPVVATVSPTGLLTAAAEGALDVTATYSGKFGSIHADVQKPGCQVTLSPDSVVFGALLTESSLTVTTTLSSCRWTARGDASWLPIQFDPGKSGSGSVFYTVPANNNVDARDATIVVSVAGGLSAVQKIHQERPVGCVYQVSPQVQSFTSAGGAGSFQVTTIPADCDWKILDSASDLGGFPTSGHGPATVNYTVHANAFVFDHTVRVQGLSGLNPPAVFTIRVQ